MKRQYMDFIPARSKAPVPKKPVVSVPREPIVNSEPEIIIKETELKVTKSEAFTIPKKPATPPTPSQVHFIKTNVAKRPLSPNAYPKAEHPEPLAEEKPKEPVAIINQPKKESRVGFIITIILVIILGAVAGTIAFFLIPR